MCWRHRSRRIIFGILIKDDQWFAYSSFSTELLYPLNKAINTVHPPRDVNPWSNHSFSSLLLDLCLRSNGESFGLINLFSSVFIWINVLWSIIEVIQKYIERKACCPVPFEIIQWWTSSLVHLENHEPRAKVENQVQEQIRNKSMYLLSRLSHTVHRCRAWHHRGQSRYPSDSHRGALRGENAWSWSSVH